MPQLLIYKDRFLPASLVAKYKDFNKYVFHFFIAYFSRLRFKKYFFVRKNLYLISNATSLTAPAPTQCNK